MAAAVVSSSTSLAFAFLLFSLLLLGCGSSSSINTINKTEESNTPSNSTSISDLETVLELEPIQHNEIPTTSINTNITTNTTTTTKLSPPPSPPVTTPCTDFYTYACSKWHRQAEATNRLTANKTLRDHSDAFTQRTMLEAFSRQSALNSSSSIAVRLLVDLHEQCLETLARRDTYREVYYETLYADLKILFAGKSSRNTAVFDVPFLEPDSAEEKSADSNQQQLPNNFEAHFTPLFTAFYSMTGEGLLFDLDTIVDLANRSRVRLAVSQNELLPALVPVFLDSYASEYNGSAVKELQALHRRLSEDDSETEDSGGSSSERMVELLEEQANLTLGDLNEQTGFNWTKVVNAVLQQNRSPNTTAVQQLYTDSDPVYAEIEYLKSALKVLRSTPARIVDNYATLTYMAFLSTTLVDGCLLEESTNVAQMVAYISSRVYVDGFVRRTSRRQVEGIVKAIDQMITYLRRAFYTTIKEDGGGGGGGEEDSAAIQQLLEMRYSIGFSQWFMDDRKLDRFYELVDDDGRPKDGAVRLVPGDYMASLRALLTHLIGVNLAKRAAPTAEESWGFPISISNAWNNPLTNHIYIPLGHLTPAIFNQSSPLSTQYGVLGFTLGHEIAHCFTVERRRRLRGGEGKDHQQQQKSSKLSSSVYRIFASHRRCFEAQYSATVESNGRRANGTRMLHENFADNLGLRAAYDAYQLQTAEAVFPFTLRSPASTRTFSSSSSTLDHLKRLEAVHGTGRDFFTAYAQQFCVRLSAEEEEMLAVMEAAANGGGKARVHASHRHRVNVPLSNFAPFAVAFNCPLGSPMHPRRRCAFGPDGGA